jgi:hypothetical protein
MLTVKTHALPLTLLSAMIAAPIAFAGCADPDPATANSTDDISCGSWCGGDDGDPYDAAGAFGATLAFIADHFPGATHLTDTTCISLGYDGYQCTISLLTGGVRCPIYTTCTSSEGNTRCDWGILYNQCH